MFDDVFDDKQWKIAREKAGLKSGLTEKVSMGDEFKRFQKDKTVAAAKALLQKVVVYEKQLKDKHAKEKYYANLLKVVQSQKTAIEAGIEAVEQPQPPVNKPQPPVNKPQPPVNKPQAPVNKPQAPVNKPQAPVDKDGKVMTDEDMDQFLDEIVEREKEGLREWENTNNDPNVPAMGAAKLLYLKLTKGFKTVEEKFKSDREGVTKLLQKCQTLETHPQLKIKPEVALEAAQRIVETLNGILDKSSQIFTVFANQAGVVRKKEGRETNATKELDRLIALLAKESDQITDTDHACRLVLKKTLQSIAGQPKAQEILGRLGV
jgi:hypothetical protein